MRRISGLALLLTATSALAADWPQWLGPNRDGTSPEAIKPWKGDLKVLWRKPVGPGHSSPVIAGGKVYLFAQVAGKEEEALHAFDAKAGDSLWTTAYERGKFWTLFGTGPQGTPTVAGGKVYTFGPTGFLTAFDAAKGTKLWQVDTEKDFSVTRLRFGAAASPLVDDGKIVLNIGGKGAGVVAFSTDKGEVAWKSLDDGPSYSSAIKAKGEYVVLTSEGVRGLSPKDGKLKWKVPLKDKANESSTTPMMAGDLLLAATITRGMVGLKRDGDGYKAAWKNPALTCYFSTPIPAGKHIYAVTAKMQIVPTSSLRCIEAATGKVLWTKESIGTWHAAMLKTKDGKLLLLSDHGDLILFQPDAKEYKELARTKVTKVKGIWAHPALSDGKVYLRDDKELICIQMPE
jgi:outer membrane protein assembly factor BamB